MPVSSISTWPSTATSFPLRKDCQALHLYIHQPALVYLGNDGHIYTLMEAKGIFSLFIQFINFIEKCIWEQTFPEETAKLQELSQRAQIIFSKLVADPIFSTQTHEIKLLLNDLAELQKTLPPAFTQATTEIQSQLLLLAELDDADVDSEILIATGEAETAEIEQIAQPLIDAINRQIESHQPDVETWMMYDESVGRLQSLLRNMGQITSIEAMARCLCAWNRAIHGKGLHPVVLHFFEVALMEAELAFMRPTMFNGAQPSMESILLRAASEMEVVPCEMMFGFLNTGPERTEIHVREFLCDHIRGKALLIDHLKKLTDMIKHNHYPSAEFIKHAGRHLCAFERTFLNLAPNTPDFRDHIMEIMGELQSARKLLSQAEGGEELLRQVASE